MDEQKPAKKLTDRQRLFVAEYNKSRNATAAAIAAGYSKHTAQVQGSRLLSKAIIRDAVNRKIEKTVEKVDISTEKILGELQRLAFSDLLSSAFDKSGKLRSFADIPEDARRAISSVEFTKDGLKVRSWDKVKALELLGKYRKLFTDKVEVSGKLSLEQLILGGDKPEGEK